MQRYVNSLASTSTGLPLSGALVTVQYYPQGTGGITTPIASPGVVNWTAHGMVAGQPFVPAGTWPTGVTPGQLYYVLAAGLTANSFEMSATPGGAPVNFTVSAGSGQSINAPIYNTNSTGALLTNPITSDVNGSFGFYAPDGRYQLTIAPSGGGSSILADILLDDTVDGNFIALAIADAPAKATPVGADMLGIWDSVTGLLNQLSFTNLLAYLTAVFANLFVKPGTIIDFGGTAAPTGYLACPNASGGAQIVSRTTYADLFAAIGTTWGVGDGSTTFGIPWFPADYAAVQANANVGTDTVGQILAHTHTVPSGGPLFLSGAASGGQTLYGNPQVTGSTGGAANLPAGVRVLKCVKY